MIYRGGVCKVNKKCDQSNYSSHIISSHIPIEFGQTGNCVIRSADPEHPTVEPNSKWIGRPLAQMWPFEISQCDVLGRSPVGQSSIYTSSYADLIYSSSVRQERSARGVKRINYGDYTLLLLLLLLRSFSNVFHYSLFICLSVLWCRWFVYRKVIQTV